MFTLKGYISIILSRKYNIIYGKMIELLSLGFTYCIGNTNFNIQFINYNVNYLPNKKYYITHFYF